MNPLVRRETRNVTGWLGLSVAGKGLVSEPAFLLGTFDLCHRWRNSFGGYLGRLEKMDAMCRMWEHVCERDLVDLSPAVEVNLGSRKSYEYTLYEFLAVGYYEDLRFGFSWFCYRIAYVVRLVRSTSNLRPGILRADIDMANSDVNGASIDSSNSKDCLY
jgi:hypothetical protein